MSFEDEDDESGPLRRCAVTRERLPKERMIRFVVAPDGRIVPDLAAKLPGRGIWLSALRDVVETARTRGVFAKVARAPVLVPADLVVVLQSLLARRIGEHLGLARRAGQAVCGFAKVREWIDADRAALVLQAADGSAEERARCLGNSLVPALAPLDGATLGAVFGRGYVVHVAVAPGGLADIVRIETERLAGLEQDGRRGESAQCGRAGRLPGGDAGRDDERKQGG